VGPDENVYVVVGNLLANADERFEGYSLDQNIKDGEAPDGRGDILRVTYSYMFFHSSNDDNFFQSTFAVVGSAVAFSPIEVCCFIFA